MVDLLAFAKVLDPRGRAKELAVLRPRPMRRLLKKLQTLVKIEPELAEIYESFLWMILSLPNLKMSYDISKAQERAKVYALFQFLTTRVEMAFWSINNLMAQTKSACLTCRRFSLSSDHVLPQALWLVLPKKLGYTPSRSAMMQISMLSRALPRKKDVSGAVADQIANLSQASVELTHADYLHLRTYGRRVFGRINPVPKPNFTTRAASYSYSRKRGGKGQEVLDIIKGLDPYDQLPQHEGFGREGSLLKIQSAHFHSYGSLLANREYHLDSKAIPILERGWKVRMVSCSDPIRNLRSESYRSVLYRKLKNVEACRTALMGEPTRLKFRNVVRGAIVYSADLSAATDKLSWGAINALCEGLGIPFDLVAGGTLDGHEMRRGTLMGIPLSWPFLSIIHNWAIERMGISRGSYHIKGDDLIALWCLEEIAFYEHHLPLLTGMELNHNKTLLGRTCGVFCERFFRKNRSVIQNEWDLTLVSGVFSLRPFMGMDDPGYPPEIALSEYLWTLKGRVPWEKIRRLSKVFEARRLPPTIRRFGDIVYLPPYMGGLSLIPPKCDQKVSPWLARIATAIHNGDGDAAVRALRLNLKFYYEKNSAEFVASKGLEYYDSVTQYRVQGHSPALEYFYAHLLELWLFWARFRGSPQGTLSFRRYTKVLSHFMRKTGKKVGAAYAALPWTVVGVRELMARLGPATVDLSAAPKNPAADEWFAGILANDHRDLPTLLRGDPRVSPGFNLHLRNTVI